VVGNENHMRENGKSWKSRNRSIQNIQNTSFHINTCFVAHICPSTQVSVDRLLSHKII